MGTVLRVTKSLHWSKKLLCLCVEPVCRKLPLRNGILTLSPTIDRYSLQLHNLLPNRCLCIENAKIIKMACKMAISRGVIHTTSSDVFRRVQACGKNFRPVGRSGNSLPDIAVRRRPRRHSSKSSTTAPSVFFRRTSLVMFHGNLAVIAPANVLDNGRKNTIRLRRGKSNLLDDTESDERRTFG